MGVNSKLTKQNTQQEISTMKLITVASALNVKAVHMSIKNTHSEINEPKFNFVGDRDDRRTD